MLCEQQRLEDHDRVDYSDGILVVSTLVSGFGALFVLCKWNYVYQSVWLFFYVFYSVCYVMCVSAEAITHRCV